MDGTTQRTLAVWTMLCVPFFLVVPVLARHGDLTGGFVLAYWTPVVVCTYIGVLPRPWEVLPGQGDTNTGN